ncbi:Coiled-coil domain-containing protein 124-like protein [Penicillium ucsense]|uniref:Coiled-coil domain-containing protein 124-like protein n=2 Tax=Penicillium TaxID=5073 RepID=A0A8J8W2P3_9EURO|nr:Coiled-coil domain-containing protein [Penicillium diatomitis]KAF7716087.1 Coiled-coil domain-containing protein 124-like protein [Penicillium ucsense]KAF7735548.1 Coiled-coil domain-containing protein 124-like protein [Penicillium ucsense]KAJ5491375.1 Coiled-coil domain-containing protein [Penicillium diatomitis]
MGGKKAAGENSKKAAGNARKADAAASKKAAEDSKRAAEEDKEWSKGAKGNAKKEDAEAKKAEAARKKAERDALLAAEEASQPAKAKGAGAKTAQKKTRGLDLSQLDEPSSGKHSSALNASGIDNALDALSLTSKDTSKVERHPERRFKAAYAAFEARRLPEIEQENPGLRRQQRVDLCRKEFEKSEENPFNQVHVAVNASKDEIAQVRDAERKKTEGRLTK